MLIENVVRERLGKKTRRKDNGNHDQSHPCLIFVILVIILHGGCVCHCSRLDIPVVGDEAGHGYH